ncbi:MAG: hypothetical protein ACLQI7_16920 [Streptosporangiaceae bacterium]|jgi:hypothetical protein
MCTVDAPLLLGTDPADKVSQVAGVDSADLLDKDAAGDGWAAAHWPREMAPGRMPGQMATGRVRG